MNRINFRAIVLLGVVSLLRTNVPAQEPVADRANDPHFKNLGDPSMDVRIEALRQLHTSLDPRLPDALLPLLSDEGNSIRRLAARAVGSRWHQIPADKVETYLTALRPLADAREEYSDIANMADRAIGLLSRIYTGSMLSPSPDGKWVVYERFGMPCLIDIGRNNEELLGWTGGGRPGWFAPGYGNGEMAGAAMWEPSSRALALVIIVSRKASAILIWKPTGSELITFEEEAILKALKVEPSTFRGYGGFFITPRRWHRGEFQFDLYYVTQAPGSEEHEDHETVVGWSLDNGKLREVPSAERPAPAAE